MAHPKKKSRGEPAETNDPISTTHTGQTLHDLLCWLKVCGTIGLEDDRFNFQNSAEECGGSLGGFAARSYAIGDVLFSIPLSCLISISNASDTNLTKLVRDAAAAFGDRKLVTSELLIWLFMIQQLAESGGHFHPFLRSLDPRSPSPLSWPHDLTAALLGTNMSTMSNSSSSIKRHSQFLDDVRIWAFENERDCSFMEADRFNITTLIWARGHYLARRYPGTFSSRESYERSLVSSAIGFEDVDASHDGREQGMMNLGALVPLLDILNHNPEREWLTFKVSDDYLHVTCNYPIEKGDEIYSNYGSLSNEMLLYAYGFCLETNDDDAVTLQLMGHNSNTARIESQVSQFSDVEHIGTFYVQSGGMAGIPNELWRQLTLLIGSDKHDEDGSNKNHTTEHCGVDSDTMLISGRTIPDTFLVDADEGKNSQADESDDEQALEIGIDECSLLKECLEKKYASLTATDESAFKILVTFTDPRALYVKWYRAGQASIMKEAIEALTEAIDGCEE